jgi:hypothetical protein
VSEDVAQLKINRGQRAELLLDDPVLNEAFDALLAEANNTSDNSKPNELQLREECYLAKQSIKALRKKLAYWVSDGKIEQAQVDELNKQKAGEDVAA